MALTFARTRGARTDWRRELAPVIAVAGLAADYFSPPALWTLLLPMGSVVLLLALRRRAAAAAVFLLSSWVFIPLAAHATSAVQELRGEHRLFVLDDDTPQPSLNEAVADRCLSGDVGFEVLPVGPGRLVNPRWALRRTIVSFAELYNQLLIDSFHQDPASPCE
jgi:hypothetical protein